MRRAVASDVKRARRDFCALLLGPQEALAAILELASRPGEGRVRQMIATAVRVERLSEEAKEDMRQWLQRWLGMESDEFARTAIANALQTIEPIDRPAAPSPEAMPAEIIAAYAYVSERLCHRVRNCLTVPSAMLVRLEQLCGIVQDAAVRSELTQILALLCPAVHRLSRVVEFDTGDGYMRWQAVPLGDWLDGASSGLAARFGQASFSLIGTPQARRLRVRAALFLLENVFGNLWTNSVQAAEHAGLPSCHITAEVNAVGAFIDVLVRDNGPGFPTRMVESAFRLPFSTKSETRGRGLLEVAEAVSRLHGDVKLVPVAANEHRVLVRLPQEAR